jgi:hypothetical protein
MRFGLYAVLLCALAACNDPSGPGGTHGEFLLEVEYMNYAWSPQFAGFYVDAQGDVYSYDRKGAFWEHHEARVVSEAQLTEKFSLNRVLVTTRDSAEVAAVAARINQINPNQLSQEKYPCADAGAFTFRAYRYNSRYGTYTPVLLRVEGDRAQENTSQAARDLVTYLRSLGLLAGIPVCGP